MSQTQPDQFAAAQGCEPGVGEAAVPMAVQWPAVGEGPETARRPPATAESRCGGATPASIRPPTSRATITAQRGSPRTRLSVPWMGVDEPATAPVARDAEFLPDDAVIGTFQLQAGTDSVLDGHVRIGHRRPVRLEGDVEATLLETPLRQPGSGLGQGESQSQVRSAGPPRLMMIGEQHPPECPLRSVMAGGRAGHRLIGSSDRGRWAR